MARFWIQSVEGVTVRLISGPVASKNGRNFVYFMRLVETLLLYIPKIGKLCVVEGCLHSVKPVTGSATGFKSWPPHHWKGGSFFPC